MRAGGGGGGGGAWPVLLVAEGEKGGFGGCLGDSNTDSRRRGWTLVSQRQPDSFGEVEDCRGRWLVQSKTAELIAKIARPGRNPTLIFTQLRILRVKKGWWLGVGRTGPSGTEHRKWSGAGGGGHYSQSCRWLRPCLYPALLVSLVAAETVDSVAGGGALAAQGSDGDDEVMRNVLGCQLTY